MKLTISQIASIIGATPIGAPTSAEYSLLLTDSRSLTRPEQTVFLALRTDVNDGHNYINNLYLNGVRAFIVEDLSAESLRWPDATFLKVPSVLEALHKLGAAARSAYRGRVVAVTGSQGKTCFKEILYKPLLDNGLRAWHSPRSWNSQIGVPLALWRLPDDSQPDDVAIIEAGIDREDQMAPLAAMIRPDLGVLTCLTDEHDEGFGGTEQKLREKLKLFASARSVFIGADLPAGLPEMTRALLPGKEIIPPAPADSIADQYAISAQRVAEELSGGKILISKEINHDVQTRIDVHDGVNSCIIISDYFTSDPDSLAEALDFARRRADGHPVAMILGDMVFGRHTEVAEVYTRASHLLELYGVKRLFLVGDIARHADCFNPAMLKAAFPDIRTLLTSLGDDDFDNETILVKGGSELRAVTRHLESPRHDTSMEINLNALVHNFNHYRSLLRPSTGIICMVKASAYGTGAIEVAHALQAQGAAYLAVAVVDEGVDLRRAGITMPIVVLNPITSNYRSLFRYSLEPAVFSLDELKRLQAEAKAFKLTDYPVHIKFDTGMHRVGFLESDIDALAAGLLSDRTLRVASAFSHLATADCTDQDDYTAEQFDNFERATEALRRGLGYAFKRHLLNTAGIQRFAHRQYDMVRLGVGLYGIDPVGPPRSRDLQTVATLTSTIISLKHWPEGTPIGYGRRGHTSRPAIIATIPIGYADGIDRHLGCGRGRVYVNGHFCPTVGNICMDLCMIDVTDANAKIGDCVEIFGPHAPIEEVADTLGTIPYEVLTSVSPRVKRVYFRE